MACVGAFGINLQVGDFVVYPGRKRSNIWVHYGIIVEIGKHNVSIIRAKIGYNPDIHSDGIKSVYATSIKVNVKQVSRMVKINFSDTRFSNPSCPEYNVYQQVWNTLNMLTTNNIGDFDDVGC